MDLLEKGYIVCVIKMPGYLCVFQTSRLTEKCIFGKVIFFSKNTALTKDTIRHQGLFEGQNFLHARRLVVIILNPLYIPP